jgi:hypothetical protein
MDNFNGHSFNIDFIVHAKEDSLLPAPVSVVFDFDRGEENSTRCALEDGRVTDDNSSLFFVTFALIFPWVFTFGINT